MYIHSVNKYQFFLTLKKKKIIDIQFLFIVQESYFWYIGSKKSREFRFSSSFVRFPMRCLKEPSTFSHWINNHLNSMGSRDKWVVMDLIVKRELSFISRKKNFENVDGGT